MEITRKLEIYISFKAIFMNNGAKWNRENLRAKTGT